MAATTTRSVNDAKTIETILKEWLEYGYASTGLTVFDPNGLHFMLLEQSWNGPERLHRVIAHVDLIDGKFWIQQDLTPTGIGADLERAGVPKNRIVLAFYPLEHRIHGEYAAQ
jgi:XisI protein